MRTQVARIQHQLGTTMLYVTHDQTEAMTLGDRVAVMRGGIIQQVDTPKVLYEHPDNLFVAGFIGSPAMNFVPARLEDGLLKLPFGDAPIPPGLKTDKREVIAGIRPEHFEDAAIDPSGMRFKAKLDLVESMGSELYAYFETKAEEVHSDQLDELAEDAGLEEVPGSGSTVVARLDAHEQGRDGREIELALDAAQIKLFDPDGGRALTLGRLVVELLRREEARLGFRRRRARRVQQVLDAGDARGPCARPCRSARSMPRSGPRRAGRRRRPGRPPRRRPWARRSPRKISDCDAVGQRLVVRVIVRRSAGVDRCARRPSPVGGALDLTCGCGSGTPAAAPGRRCAHREREDGPHGSYPLGCRYFNGYPERCATTRRRCRR